MTINLVVSMLARIGSFTSGHKSQVACSLLVMCYDKLLDVKTNDLAIHYRTDCWIEFAQVLIFTE